MRLINARSPFGDLSPQIIGPRLKFDVHARVLLPQRNFFAFRLKTDSFGTARSAVQSIFTSFSSVSSGILSLNQSATSFKDFRVYADVGEREIKVRVDVSGARTQEIFDDVFSKLVDAAQPIPGFRRVKGGKTPEVPKDVLIQIIGPSKVKKETILQVINTTVNEYVSKEGLNVTKELRVEQSYDEIEAAFIPGEEFSFEAIIGLQQTSKS
ncbi:uncharacterized protein LOC110033420 isoform X1 [Phalaenopsis equestris]|uniref:uncharacterized protein LOC110033420 isoform X1 n=1 Tax=Phalaenopsis equestris TaxID=78828 RepID=UPI0009E544C6|nr:uncharacterized protein LOC110033420 isoform X1 [Phalaenopsis equestris]